MALLRARIGKGLGLALVLSLASPALGAEPDLLPPPTRLAQASTLTLDLGQCLQLAHQRQPRIAAARAAVSEAQDNYRALHALQVPTLIAPDLPVRRVQAALGLTSAAAGLDQAERNANYAVTRAYFTVLFAREQERVAAVVVDRLAAVREVAQGQLDDGVREVTAADVNRTVVYLRLAQTKQVEAEQGVKRALIALKEAIGLGHEFDIQVSANRLPEAQAAPERTAIVAWALARRGELIQSGTLAKVTALEIEAQASSHRKRMQTFAAGADIHAEQVPQEARNHEFRPGALPPGMPVMLVGSRAERVQRAQSLSARAHALVETTRNLIALESEDAFLRWEEASRQVKRAREATSAGESLADDLAKGHLAGLKVRVEDVVNARVLASQARAQLNEALYHQLLTLADLERTTAGAFCARLVEATVPPPEPRKEKRPAEAPANGMGMPVAFPVDPARETTWAVDR